MAETEALLVVTARNSRLRARAAATAEILQLLSDLGAREARGGPNGELRGVSWLMLPESNIASAAARLRRLGYTRSIHLVREQPSNGEEYPTVRWRGRPVGLVPIYDEPDDDFREQAPDRRTFVLECGDGVVRPIAGYRGGRGHLEHRALPVVDARLLVNLVWSRPLGHLLDPFAGAGGIIAAANQAGWHTTSLDADRHLRFGLAVIAQRHVIGDATNLPFRAASVDAVASEPPYHPGALSAVVGAVPEIARVLKPGGRAAMLVGHESAAAVRDTARQAGLQEALYLPIDRKGTPVHLCSWIR